MQEAQNGKRKINYTLMLFVDSKEGRIRQMGIGPKLIESVAVAVLAVIVILSLICFRFRHRINDLEAERAADMETIENQATEILELQEENADLVALREELTDKVTILSDTINLKVEAEEEQEQVRAQAHMPVGFPMSSSASVE